MSDSFSWTVLAHLLRPQGRKGEILADLLTDFPDHFTHRGQLFLASPGFSGPVGEARLVHVTASWLPKGKNEGRIVFQLADCSTIEQASTLAGLDLLTPNEDRIVLSEDESYISDLVGCDLFDGDQRVGIVKDVQFPTSTDGRIRLDAAPWLVVAVNDVEILIPFVKDFLVSLETPHRRIVMKLPNGLLDVGIETADSELDKPDLKNDRPRRAR